MLIKSLEKRGIECEKVLPLCLHINQNLIKQLKTAWKKDYGHSLPSV